jgi:hypothetical protein
MKEEEVASQLRLKEASGASLGLTSPKSQRWTWHTSLVIVSFAYVAQLNAAIRNLSPNADGVLCATTMGSACVVENVWLAASLPALLLAMNHPLVQR